VETKSGVEYVRKVADLEEELGFRSSFNFVPERYPLDLHLLDELRSRGFEIGIHGLKHDGKLFNSRIEFERRAKKINHYLQEFDAVGFRTPLTHRNPEWMQVLDLEYDLSFFDTDPFEPIPGGSMSIWPFFIGHFVELPYTLVQDYTLTSVLGETTPKIWIEKVDFIEKYYGMALLNSHPDYLAQPPNWEVYRQFLLSMKERNGYWNALPRDVARWWRKRSSLKQEKTDDANNYITASLQNGDLVFSAGA
jgi:peptidoglycan/xylan/chitin deacetylase (PgdA/CDA1 family)